MSAADFLGQAVGRALNAYLDRDPDAATRLARIEDKVLALELTGLDLVLFLSVEGGRLRIEPRFEGTPDAVLRGTPLALTRLAVAADPARGLAAGGVQLEGDTDVGEAFRRLFAEVEIDWEEELSSWLGDIPAHQVGNWTRALNAWGRRSLGSLRMDLTEYLQEESRALPTRIEVEHFLDQVDTLRSDVDRLEARIRRLEQTLHRAEDRDER